MSDILGGKAFLNVEEKGLLYPNALFHVTYQTHKTMLDHISKHQKETLTEIRLFLTNFEVFGNVVKLCLE